MVTGKGVRVVDRGGTEFIDAFAGLYCVNIGYGRTEVADAIYEQARSSPTSTPTRVIPTSLPSASPTASCGWRRTT